MEPEGRSSEAGVPASDLNDTDDPVEGTRDEPGLEARLERLEKILGALEADDLELERALQLFEEGVKHVRRAERILARAELRVEELLGDESTLETRPFEEGTE